MKKHSKFSASSSDRWLNCPASIKLSEGVPPAPESKYAKEGTDAHHCLEIFLNSPKSTAKFRASLAKKYPLDMVEYALDAANAIWARMGKDAVLKAETKLDLSHIEPGMFGTADAIIAKEFDSLKVIDFKYGAGIPVDPVDNSQLAFYALGAAHALDYNFETVTMVILQPRSPNGETVREWTISMDELLTWEARFKAGVAATKKANPEINPGDHCRFCPAAPICPGLKTQALADAAVEFDDDKGTLSLPLSITPEKLSKTLTAIEKLETWIDSIKSLAFSHMEHGGEIPGFKLVEKRSTRKWVDANAVAIEAKKTFGDDAFSVDLKSPAQLEKLKGAKGWVESRVTNVSSGLTMVPNSDKRQPASRAEIDFKDA